PIFWDYCVDGFDHLARIQHPGLDIERHRVWWLRRDAMRELCGAYRRRGWVSGAELPVEAGKDGLDAGERVRSDVDVGGLLPVAQAARRIVELDLDGLAPEMPAADVVGQAGADREYDIRGLVHFLAQRREITAGGAEPERMIVEKTARGQRIGEERAATIGKLDHRIARARPQYATAAENDRPLCSRQALDNLGHDFRVWLHAPGPGLIHRRGLVGLVGHVFDLLQVVRNAQDHRAPLVFGDVKGLAHIIHHPRHAVRGDVARAGCRHQRRLVDILVVELGVDW